MNLDSEKLKNFISYIGNSPELMKESVIECSNKNTWIENFTSLPIETRYFPVFENAK